MELNANLAAALAEASRTLPPERIDRVWTFPPLVVRERESGLAVLAVVPEDGGAEGRRQVFTLRYEAVVEKGRVRRTDALEEQALVPQERLERVIDGVLRRLDAAAESPVHHAVGGDPARWVELLSGGGSDPLDSGNRE